MLQTLLSRDQRSFYLYRPDQSHYKRYIWLSQTNNQQNIPYFTTLPTAQCPVQPIASDYNCPAERLVSILPDVWWRDLVWCSPWYRGTVVQDTWASCLILNNSINLQSLSVPLSLHHLSLAPRTSHLALDNNIMGWDRAESWSIQF